MKTDLNDIHDFLASQFKAHAGLLQTLSGENGALEAKGTKEVMQGKQKVDGHHFGSIVVKPKDVRLYYFPVYTHADEFTLSPELQKCLKGKNCFHIKRITDEMEKEIGEMIAKGVRLYERDGLV